ncbi:GNAT family N-acetyltransferase [Ampullimonas aquatilis]|uniref:GNAT family N-acetyltransferase n=1 Tax=Ampullimonas aquatilis TaxID=1341549 RepID=UPI003C779160
MHAIQVSIARRHHIPAIISLVNQAYRPASDAAGWTHETGLVTGERINEQQVTALLDRSQSIILIATRKNDLLGCVHIEQQDEHAMIGMLAVLPRCQVGGIGKQLLAHAENHAAQQFHVKTLRMVVVSARHALIEFYLRRGYQRTGQTMPYPLDAGAGQPMTANMTIEVLEKSAFV